jgi:hypothetical protein
LRNNLNYTKPLIASINTNGCFVQNSHKLNTLGYFSKGYDGKLVLFHVLMWEHYYGKTPDGYVLHHVCRNRGCFNPHHLELMSQAEHMKLHGALRSVERDKQAKHYWEVSQCSGAALGRHFNVCAETACSWIRRWKGSV